MVNNITLEPELTDTKDNLTYMPRGTVDVRVIAMSYMIYKVSVVLDKVYFAILVPVGVTGNLLSFLVMVQKHNRHMSFSLYIAVLAVTDTISLLINFFVYLEDVWLIEMPLNELWDCIVRIAFAPTATMCSTLLILAMTFERFYSIIRPHKAASFNTVKRAKVTIVCVIIFSIAWNIQHIFTMSHFGKFCIPGGKITSQFFKDFYFWFSFTINFALPFVFLLAMNSVIIHTLRSRSMQNVLKSVTHTSQGQGQGQGQPQGQSSDNKLKSSEKQIYITLLSITFAFLILTTPMYARIPSAMLYDFTKTAGQYAGFLFFSSIAPKLFYTNCAINFFLYVTSGQKFRTDLVNLLRCNRHKVSKVRTNRSSFNTKDTNFSENELNGQEVCN